MDQPARRRSRPAIIAGLMMIFSSRRCQVAKQASHLRAQRLGLVRLFGVIGDRGAAGTACRPSRRSPPGCAGPRDDVVSVHAATPLAAPPVGQAFQSRPAAPGRTARDRPLGAAERRATASARPSMKAGATPDGRRPQIGRARRASCGQFARIRCPARPGSRRARRRRRSGATTTPDAVAGAPADRLGRRGPSHFIGPTRLW